jgi:hypothetical protein
MAIGNIRWILKEELELWFRYKISGIKMTEIRGRHFN